VVSALKLQQTNVLTFRGCTHVGRGEVDPAMDCGTRPGRGQFNINLSFTTHCNGFFQQRYYLTKNRLSLLTNPAMPGMVKIGMTNRDSVDARMKELFNTSVPVLFECEYVCKVDDSTKVENALLIMQVPYYL